MRRLLPLFALFLAACAATPTPQPSAPVAPAAADTQGHRTLNGMTAGELVAHFGKPRLQIVEGAGTKIQFAGPACILDFYLYPAGSGGGTPRVTDVEARNFQGAEVNAQSCVYTIERNEGR